MSAESIRIFGPLTFSFLSGLLEQIADKMYATLLQGTRGLPIFVDAMAFAAKADPAQATAAPVDRTRGSTN
jgi:hypothetical protein